MKLQVFDLDGTLIMANSFHLWIRFLASSWRWQPHKLLQLGFILALRLLRQINHPSMKQRILQLSQGFSPAELERFCQQLETHLHPEVLERFRQARALGYTTCLNTAAPELYSVPFGRRLGFDVVIATPQPSDNPLAWQENLGQQKVLRLQEQFPRASLAVVYSDEAADLPLMGLAEHTVLVRPKTRDLESVKADHIQPEVLN